MSDPIKQAQQRARAARSRLVASLGLLRLRLSPGAIARDVKDSVVTKGTEVARTGADAIIDHKWSVAGAASLIGLFLARKPISGLFSRDETDAASARLSDEPAPPAKDSK